MRSNDQESIEDLTAKSSPALAPNGSTSINNEKLDRDWDRAARVKTPDMLLADAQVQAQEIDDLKKSGEDAIERQSGPLFARLLQIKETFEKDGQLDEGALSTWLKKRVTRHGNSKNIWQLLAKAAAGPKTSASLISKRGKVIRAMHERGVRSVDAETALATPERVGKDHLLLKGLDKYVQSDNYAYRKGIQQTGDTGSDAGQGDAPEREPDFAGRFMDLINALLEESSEISLPILQRLMQAVIERDLLIIEMGSRCLSAAAVKIATDSLIISHVRGQPASRGPAPLDARIAHPHRVSPKIWAILERAERFKSPLRPTKKENVYRILQRLPPQYGVRAADGMFRPR